MSSLRNCLESPNGFIQPHILDTILRAEIFTSAGKRPAHMSLNANTGSKAFSLWSVLGNVFENISSVLMHSSAKVFARLVVSVDVQTANIGPNDVLGQDHAQGLPALVDFQKLLNCPAA